MVADPTSDVDQGEHMRRRFLISGRVQGVFFRRATHHQAQRLGLTGFVRNLADGRVEVKAEGDEDQIRLLEDFLAQGPPEARVDAIASTPTDEGPWDDFEIR